MRKILIIIILLISSLSFISCKDNNDINDNTVQSNEDNDTTNYKGELVSDVVIDQTNIINIVLGEEISTDNYSQSTKKVKIEKTGIYEFTGILNGQIKINTTEKVVIILSNVTITATEQAINSESLDFYIISKEGSINSLTDGTTYEKGNAVINCDGKVTFDGTGTLNLYAKSKHGIKATDIVVWNTTINVCESITDGLHADNTVVVNSGVINSNTTSDGIESENTLVINGGTLNITCGSDGLVALNAVEINNGIININSLLEGIESKGTLAINNGYIQITSVDDSLNAATKISINGGKNYFISSNNDAIDSNGTILITGGLTLAFGTTQPECGIDCDNNEFKITGGTLLACGGSNSKPTSNLCTQNILQIGTNVAKNTYVNISDGNNDIITFKTPSACSQILFTSNLIITGKTYTASTGGKADGVNGFGCLLIDCKYLEGNKVGSSTILTVITNIGSISNGGAINGQIGPRR